MAEGQTCFQCSIKTDIDIDAAGINKVDVTTVNEEEIEDEYASEGLFFTICPCCNLSYHDRCLSILIKNHKKCRKCETNLGKYYKNMEYDMKEFMDTSDSEAISRLAFYACKYWNFSLIMNMIENGLDVNLTNKNGESLMSYAYHHHIIGISRCLYENGANIEASLMEDECFIFNFMETVCRNGRFDTFMKLIEMEDFRKLCPELMISVCQGSNTEIFDYIMENFVKPNFEVIHDFECFHIPMMERLLKLGVVDFTDNSQTGNSTFMLAIWYGKVDAIKYILDHYDPIELFNSAAYGWTVPFTVAAQLKNLDLMKLFCSYGADVNISGKGRKTALFLACEQSNSEMVSFLMEKGADPTIRSDEHFLAYSSCTDMAILQMLRVDPPEIESLDFSQSQTSGFYYFLKICFEGRLALFNEILTAHPELVNRSIEPGDKLVFEYNFCNVITKHKFEAGSTALHVLCRIGAKQMAKILIQKGADVNKKTSVTGITALHQAFYSHNSMLIRLLIKKHGADLCAVTSDGLGVANFVISGREINITRKKGYDSWNVEGMFNLIISLWTGESCESFSYDEKYPTGDSDDEKDPVDINETECNGDGDGDESDWIEPPEPDVEDAKKFLKCVGMYSIIENIINESFLDHKITNYTSFSSTILKCFINYKNRFGKTLLHYFCENRNEDWVVELLKAGADPKAVDNEGNRLVIKFRDEDNVEIFEKYGIEYEPFEDIENE